MICLRRGDGTPSSGGLSKTEMDCARTSTSESHGFNRGSVNITAISNARILKFTMLRFLFSPPEIQSIVHCTTLNLFTVIFFHRDSSQPTSLSLFIKKTISCEIVFWCPIWCDGCRFRFVDDEHLCDDPSGNRYCDERIQCVR